MIRVIASWLANQACVERVSAQCGTVTLIQHLGSALNLNIHFHMVKPNRHFCPSRLAATTAWLRCG